MKTREAARRAHWSANVSGRGSIDGVFFTIPWWGIIAMVLKWYGLWFPYNVKILPQVKKYYKKLWKSFLFKHFNPGCFSPRLAVDALISATQPPLGWICSRPCKAKTNIIWSSPASAMGGGRLSYGSFLPPKPEPGRFYHYLCPLVLHYHRLLGSQLFGYQQWLE